MKEPSDTPEFYDADKGKSFPEYIDKQEWIDKQEEKSDFIIDALTSLDEQALMDIFTSCRVKASVEERTHQQLIRLLDRWFDLAKQRGDDDVFKEEENEA